MRVRARVIVGVGMRVSTRTCTNWDPAAIVTPMALTTVTLAATIAVAVRTWSEPAASRCRCGARSACEHSCGRLWILQLEGAAPDRYSSDLDFERAAPNVHSTERHREMVRARAVRDPRDNVLSRVIVSDAHMLARGSAALERG